MFLNIKSKHIIKGAITQIQKKQCKLTSESISLQNPKIKPKQKS